jgi:transposase
VSIVQSYLGVDVSKAKLDVALLLPNDKFKSKVFANDGRGHEALLQWLHSQLPGGLQDLHICMEATGVYHEALACALHDQLEQGEAGVIAAHPSLHVPMPASLRG